MSVILIIYSKLIKSAYHCIGILTINPWTPHAPMVHLRIFGPLSVVTLSAGRFFFLGPPRDCKVSEWSPWSPCSESCGIGEAVRIRKVLKHPKRGGKPCPPEMKEVK